MSGNYPQGQWPPRQQQWPPQPQQQWPTQPGYRQQVQPYQPPQYPPQPYRQPMTVAPRSPALGAVLGLLIPGLGCMVNGRAGFGVLILALWILSLPLILIFVGWVLVPATWIWSGVMGYQAAQDWNRRHGIIS